jgi:hypothetical protein
LPHKLNSAALFLLLLPGRRRHRVRNHGHRTLGIAVPRPCLFGDTITVAVWTGFHVCCGRKAPPCGQILRTPYQMIGYRGAMFLYARPQEGSRRFNCPPTLCLKYGTPTCMQRTSSSLSESCPKIGDLPKSPFPSAAALVPSAGTTTLQIS